MEATSQEQAVLERIIEQGHISSLEANQNMGITRLSAIIYNLRHKGHQIETLRFISTRKNRYGNYSKYCIYFYK